MKQRLWLLFSLTAVIFLIAGRDRVDHPANHAPAPETTATPELSTLEQ